MERKVFIGSLDGGSPSLIKAWAEKGELPNLGSLIHDGVFGELLSTILPITPTAWTSFMTGKNPGKHGIFDFVSRGGGSQLSLITCPRDRKSLLWNLIGITGRKTITINVPMTYPPWTTNGIMISGLPALESRGDFTFPKELRKEIEEEVGSYDIHYKVEFTGDNGMEYLQHIKMVIGKRTAVAKYLMERKPWNFFMVNYQASDWVQHFFWKYMDEEHPRYVPNAPTYLKNAILNTYKWIDAGIGELLELLDNDVYKIVLSDHGFGPLNKVVYLNNLLREWGLLKFKRNLKYFLFKLGFTSENVYKLLVRLNIANLVPRFRDRKYNVLNFFLGLSDVDWSKTVAYSVGHNGQIYLNIRRGGDEKIAGEKYEKERAQILKLLENFRDPETGKPIFDRVFRKEEIYQGPYLKEAPDIVALLTRYNQETNYSSGKVLGEAPNLLTGYHRMRGVVIVDGPGVKKGVHLSNARLIDIASTVLHIMGIPIPEDKDGRVLQEIFEDDFLRLKSVGYQKFKEKEKVGRNWTLGGERNLKCGRNVNSADIRMMCKHKTRTT